MLMAATKISAAMSMMTTQRQLQLWQNKAAITNPDSGLTDPLELLSVTMAQLILKHRQQVRNDVEPLRQEPDALVHLEIRPNSLVNRLQLGFDPEEFGSVEHGAIEMDVDAEDEQLPDLHVDLRPGQGYFARQCDLGRYVLAGVDGGGNELFEQGRLVRVSSSVILSHSAPARNDLP
jgi:hypothetical protein